MSRAVKPEAFTTDGRRMRRGNDIVVDRDPPAHVAVPVLRELLSILEAESNESDIEYRGS